ncbi:ATP-dependent Lon protease pim1 [Bacidia gigantensis]|uniref:ATP-dependent Lon protease pim1 n=1 Tax=Bacidia gigantensis TaxID=2732470 RepID=UPI001D0406FD|nr:ATP-dependent Lon protease pim1 [Bacidia gigantensis]KAG8531747.1 ATP-dependent Lon protease pim1 [Bacidia gigantensis]
MKTIKGLPTSFHKFTLVLGGFEAEVSINVLLQQFQLFKITSRALQVMASKSATPAPLDPMDFFPFRGQYGGSSAGALLFISVRATLPLLFYSLLAPTSSPYSIFSKVPWALPSRDPPTNDELYIVGLPDGLLRSLNDCLGLSSYGSLLLLGVTLPSLSFTAYNLLWRRERLPMTGQGGSVQITTQVNLIDAVHALLFVYLAARNPTWSPQLFRWTPIPFVFGWVLHVLADHSKYLFRKDQRNRGKVYTGGVWGLVRHPNFLGFTIWRVAFASASGGWAFGMLMLANFVYLFWATSVSILEGYMEESYGKEWDRAKRAVPYKMIPGICHVGVRYPIHERRISSLRPSPSLIYSKTHPSRLPNTHRPLTTSPPRRKEKKPDEIPEPIPQKEITFEQNKELGALEKQVDGSSEARKTPESPSSGATNVSDGKGSAATGSGGESGSGSGDGGKKGGRKSSSEKAIQKPSIPEIYPQVMAIPIAKRPLFPGFYKAITVRDPNVTAAIQEMMKRGQPYVGAFLFKDDTLDKDIIESMDDVHDVGVFAQITSAFPVTGEHESLTVVLYPHRRIRISKLLPPKTSNAGPTIVEAEKPDEEPPKHQPSIEKSGDVVASFEEPSTQAQEKETQSYEITSFLQDYPVSLVNVENMFEEKQEKNSPVMRAVTSEIVSVFREVANLNHLFRDQISTFTLTQSTGNVHEDPAKLADFAAAVSAGELKELQDVLETMNIEERLQKALMVLKKELMNAQLQSKISKDVESKIQKRQREYWLMEQMKGIRRELGIESDGKDKMIEKFREKANKLAMPEAVKKTFDEELNKLAHLEQAASEFNVTRNYLDWLTQIPWGQQSAENFGIQNAMTVLDEDHHGLKDVKDRILEFIAVGKLRGTVEGKILCFVGPPGVGKTSIGKSIARALNRQYYRFSVGGLSDVAEIKGHRRTYVGALPGRIIQALKKCQTENPLILIDEIDKVGRGHQGDPSSALLELLDPEQNNSFLDHYMDVPVDLSKVLFVCTANMTDTIPRPLLDRMEVIELSGYVADEKMAIADRFLAPAAKDLSGLKDVDVILNKGAIEELINRYCRESGVRNLKKQIEKVYRKSALNIIKDVGEEVFSEEKGLTEEGKAAAEEAKKDDSDVKDTPASIDKETTTNPRKQLKVPDSVSIAITRENLKDYVGPPIFTSDRLYETTPPGVAMGLAWTSMGGAALYVESILETTLSASSRPGLERTGNLKNVMKESTHIAYSFAKGLMAEKFSENKFFDKAKLHLHCPEGAVQKDGPSAGITMATSLMSLALGKSLDPTVAMTGELTLTGKVLRIGGLREKTVAARRAGAGTIIFPKDNWGDWLELPENIKEGITGHAADWYSDVFDLVFPDIDPQQANNIWKDALAKKSEKDKAGEEKEEDD